MNFNTFKESVDSNNFSQNYIFEGNENFLNEALEYFLKKVLNKENDFKIKRQIEERTHPDLLFIEKEKNNIPIEKIRNLIEYVQKSPVSKYKIVVIKNGELLRKEAANALLKTLEESFSYVIIVILTNSRYNLLDTIVSRCLVVSCEKIEKINFKLYEKLLNLIDMALDKNFSSITNFENMNYLLSLKDDKDFLKVFFEVFKEFYIFLETKNQNIDENLLKIFKKYTDYKKEKVLKILYSIQTVKENLNNNVNFRLSLEKIFVDILN